MLLAFNLVPAFPLDGGRVLRSLLWWATGNLKRATYWAALGGQGFATFLIVTGVLLFLGGDLPHGIWLGLIGLFLHRAARQSYQDILMQEILGSEPVSRFMSPAPVTVSRDVDLRSWVDDYVYRYHRKFFPVASDGHLQGVISTAALRQFPRSEWEHRTVGEAMLTDLDAMSIGPDASALQALQKMAHSGVILLLVSEGDTLIGTISMKDLQSFLELKLELEGDASRELEPPEDSTDNLNGDVHEARPRTPWRIPK
jgi:hypothetical protein